MNDTVNRRRFVSFMAMILGGAAVGYGGPVKAFAKEKSEDEVGVAWLRLACTSQSFVGQGAGMGAMQQLIMKHDLFNAGAETIEALGAGVLQASYLGVTPAVGAITNGVKVRIYVGGHRRGMGLVIPANSPIKSVRDLRGKNVSTLGRGSLPDMQLRVTAQEHGLNADRDFNLLTLPSSDAVTALSKGTVDALMNCPEWPQVALTTIKGSRFLLTDIDGSLWHGPETQCVVVIIKTDFANKERSALKKLLQVHVKASRFLLEHPVDSSHIIAKYEGCPPAASQLALSQMHVTPVPSVDSIVKWRDKMFEFGYTKRKAKIEELLDLAPLREVLVEAGEKQWLSDLDKEIVAFNKIRRSEA